MNILIPTADYPPIEGGIGTVALHVARELAAQGHETTVVAPRFPNMDVFDEAEPLHVVRYGGYGLGWLRLVPMCLATLAYLRRADLILGINVSYGGLLGWCSRKLFGKRYLTFAYAYEFLKFEHNPLLRALLRSIYNTSTLVVAISEYTTKRLVEFGVDPSKIETILPGAEIPKGAPDASVQAVKEKYVLDSGPVILAVGRFVPRKGHLTLIRAMPKILETHPSATLLLAGRGPLMPPVARLACELGVRDSVRIPGRVSDEELACLYEACDVFALPTGSGAGGQVEGFGLVFTEAHAHGKPVVAGRSGGVVDAVIDGETGILVEPDEPDATASAILSLLDDRDLASRLGENGRARVEAELNWAEFSRRLMRAIEERS